MKKIILLFWVLFTNTAIIAQEWKLEIGSNLTRYVFTNSSGNNPEYLKSSAGYHLGISKENKLSRYVFYDIGIVLNQYNAVGDVQNIPFSYQTNFLGLSGGVGPKISISRNLTFVAKASASLQIMYNGTQLVQNNYFDLSSDSQFTGAKVFVGYTIELSQKVNKQMALFTSFQHFDTNSFGKSTLNFIPSTINFGIKIGQ